MFVAHDGADVWANQHLFFLDETGARTFMAGVPPDYFSEAGQLWGNPLYRWSVLKRTDYAWWVARLEHTLARFDALRLDHFIAFHRYWEIQGDAVSAKQGRFVKVPGKHFFRRIKKQLGGLPFVAEDLGLVTPKVQELRDQFGLPGMRVLQFGFSKGAEMYQPHRYPPNSVVYTGTHDNDTLVGWLNATSSDKAVAKSMREERERARQYTGASQADHWDLIRILLMSAANTAIFPLQDLLGLGSEARMNVPGTPWGNWRWRVRRGQLTARLAQTMRSACEIYERLPPADAGASQAE
jgi:4-alpha-glucanotransferase